MPSRLADLYRRLVEQGMPEPTPTRHPQAIIDRLDAARTAALAAGTELSREWQAIHHRVEVERLSLAGMRVAEIAATLSLSTRQVIELRAQLGLGRRR